VRAACFPTRFGVPADAAPRGRGDAHRMNPMSPTFAPASSAIIAALVGWLMVRVG
jgi:hypothetical protein